MKKITKVSIVGAVAAALSLGAVAPASAFPIYEDKNYGGYAYQATWAAKAGIGSMNKEGSSIRLSPGKTFYGSMDFTGRSIWIRGDVADLGSRTDNLSWPLNWNDRIQSYR